MGFRKSLLVAGKAALNGSVWAWGYNGSGQIGDNTTTERDSPVQVSGLSSSMTAVAAGQEFSYALKSDGTVRAWGYGGDGEMGDNCWCDRHTPVEVHGVNNSGYLTGISGLGQSNGYFALAYSSTGVGYTWGMNQYGQLGDDGWRQDSGTPIQVVGLKGFSNLAGGGGHSLGITSPSRTTTTYTYDDLYRLTGAANTSRTTTYGYDPLGNRSQMVRGSATTNYSYDESDRITQAQVVGGSTTSYTVNSAGDVTVRGSDSFAYDQANRLKSATVGGTTVTFVYDGDGNLYSKTVGGTTTRYVYDVAGGMARLLDDGTRRTVWGVGLAYTLDDSGGAINVYHTDGLGSVRAQTNSSASVVATWGTDEFGVVDSALTTGTSTQQLQYTGELRDPTTSFVDLRARMYDPATGRFMSADPLRKSAPGITGWNRYTYVGDDPTSLSDPSGYCGQRVHQSLETAPQPVAPTIPELPPACSTFIQSALAVPVLAAIQVQAGGLGIADAQIANIEYSITIRDIESATVRVATWDTPAAEGEYLFWQRRQRPTTGPGLFAISASSILTFANGQSCSSVSVNSVFVQVPSQFPPGMT